MIYFVLACMLLQLVCCQYIITTIAGTGAGSYSGDNGDGASAALNGPCGVAEDASGITTISYIICNKVIVTIANIGNVYIADSGNNRIRKVTASTGIITTIAGSSTSGSFSGDNGPATSATFYSPHAVAIDLSGTDTICHNYISCTGKKNLANLLICFSIFLD